MNKIIATLLIFSILSPNSYAFIHIKIDPVKDAQRLSNNIDKEAKRLEKRLAQEAKRARKRLDKEARRIKNQIDKEATNLRKGTGKVLTQVREDVDQVATDSIKVATKTVETSLSSTGAVLVQRESYITLF